MTSDQSVGGAARGATILAIVLVCLAELIDDAVVGHATAVIVFFLMVFIMVKVPIRTSMMGLMFLALFLPNPAEGFPSATYRPPFVTTGAVLLNHINTVNRSLPMPFSGLDVCFAILGIIALSRRNSGSRVDSAGRLATPQPLIRYAYLSLGITAFTWLTGLVRGGNFGMSLWQIVTVIYLPIIFLLFQVSFRGPKDLWGLAKVVLVAAIYKALLAVYVVNTVFTKVPDPETGSSRLPFGTSHQDSVLFADAFVLCLALLIERVGKRGRRIALAVLPVLAAGMLANNRRTVWVQVGLVMVAVYIISRETPLKRRIRRTIYALVPIVAVYLMAGWNSQYGSTFKPVRMIRSVVDAKSDASSMWRELENYDLIYTFKQNMLLGVGYGNPYEEVIVLPAVDYSLERYTPHNSLLGVWAYSGLIGYAGLTLLWAGGVYFAMRTYFATKEPLHRAAAMVCFGSVLIYMMQAFADLGLSTWNGVFTVAASICVAGKLAVANDQWGASKKPKPAAPAAPAPIPVDVRQA